MKEEDKIELSKRMRRKTDDLKAKGRIGLEGEVKPFTGFPEDVGRRLNVSVIPTAETKSFMEDLVLKSMADLESLTGLKLLLAGRDFPVHVTILEGLAEAPSVRDFSQSPDMIGRLRELAKRLNGVEFELANLVPAATTIITADDMPDSIVEMRASLTGFYEERALVKPLPLTDLLHSTLARITNVGSARGREVYLDKMIRLSENVTRNPVKFKVGEVYVGPALGLLNRKV